MNPKPVVKLALVPKHELSKSRPDGDRSKDGLLMGDKKYEIENNNPLENGDSTEKLVDVGSLIGIQKRSHGGSRKGSQERSLKGS